MASLNVTVFVFQFCISCYYLRFFISQEYREELAAFRNSLPRQTSRGFVDTKEENILPGKLADISSDFDKLKTRSVAHHTLLRELIERHQRFQDCASSTSDWLQEAESSLRDLKEEPIGANTDTIVRQIERVKVSSPINVDDLKDCLS